MYNWDITKLNGYDFYLYSRYLFYDLNPRNLLYIVQKAAIFDIFAVPENELVYVYADFMRVVNDYLIGEQKDIELWALEMQQKFDPEIELPDPFKNFFDKLNQENKDS